MLDRISDMASSGEIINMALMIFGVLVGFAGGAVTVWIKLSKKTKVKSSLELLKLCQECKINDKNLTEFVL